MRAWIPLAAASLLFGCGGEAPDAGLEGQPCELFSERSGEATYYAADGSGNCSFEPSSEAPLLVAALNDAAYDGARACGACARVEGPAGSVTVRIVDRCPGCGAGDIDLSPDAFERIAPLEAGRVDVSWREVPCDPPDTIDLRFKEGTNPWWTAVLVRDHRHAIAGVDYREPTDEESVRDQLLGPGPWVSMRRELYNYFLEDEGVGEGPADFRLVDVHGHELVVEGVTPGDGVTVDTGAQFPACVEP